MNEFEEFKAVLDKLKPEHEDKYWYEDTWKEAAKLFAADMNKTISFIRQCSDEEFGWMSEVFEDIAEATHSDSFVRAIKERASFFHGERERNVLLEIGYAEGIINANKEKTNIERNDE